MGLISRVSSRTYREKMYNGIGLQTARGSGTNGYVQRNMSALRFQNNKKSYEQVDKEAELFEQRLGRAPNRDLLTHEKKRKIESYREILKEKDPEIAKVGKTNEDSGKNFAETSHEIAKLNEAQQKKLRAAFGIDKNYKSGMAFNAEYHQTRKAQTQKQISSEKVGNSRFASKYDQVDGSSSNSSSSSESSSSSSSSEE